LWPEGKNEDRVPPDSGPVAAEARNVKKPTPFGKYFLLERINVGGMAEVFRAKAFGVEGFERLVAVKRILSNIAEDKEFIRMFIEEAKLSVQLNHANIAQIFDLGVVDGAYYIALEHVHGRDLRGIFDRCRQLGATMPVSQACFIVMKLCEGLDYAHNKRDQSGRELSLVHRDVSPQNVLVSFEGEVKIIDFGIAKAAGKGSKTQAGILKGKFGYMSPEQVRGLPVDRRSDVFSCGIVLYELLTGERLFVGESDFSTLEKVRNVEILPPSTYNRKIPDELERIVLKALSKDVEDRYQNAIDLHDELQAFVYTAGEFYSRKDLAGWMKKTFGKEIDEETAKLESFRQLKPPPTSPPPVRRTGMSTPVAGVKPPPTPARVSQQMAAVAPPPLPPSASGSMKARARKDETGELSWDDDELETKIYDNPEDDPKNKGAGAGAGAGRSNKALPLQPPPASASQQMASASLSAAALPPPPGESNPDLSSLVSAAKGWDGGQSTEPMSPASTLNGIGIANGRAPKLATGSNQVVSPAAESGLVAVPIQAPAMSSPMAVPAAVAARSSPELFDPLSTMGPADTSTQDLGRKRDRGGQGQSGKSGQRGKKGKGLVWLALGGAALTAGAVATVLVVTAGKPETTAPGPTAGGAPTGSGMVQSPQPPPVDPNTGFDLYVQPAGIVQWRLDGEARTERLPSQIRGISPGAHTVQIDGPPGFLSQTKKVEVVSGKAERVDIKLEPIQGITGTFDSSPAGATVSLIVDGKRQELGPAPAKAPLEPGHTYQVLFEKPGYVSVNRPIVLSGALEEKTVVTLEKVGAVTAEAPKTEPPKTEPPKTEPPKVVTAPKTEPPKVVTAPKPEPPKVVTAPKPEPPKVVTPPKTEPPKAAGGSGTLALGSKPSCEIYVDGATTGLYTPQPAMKLSAGKHRITLINNEYGIKESFTVEISPDKPAKMIKDFSDRLPK
jgi:eukaryotic-like serine/threonine-protein kinase